MKRVLTFVLMIFSLPIAATANLVTNGGFEGGATGFFPTVPAWTVVGAFGTVGDICGGGGFPSHSGLCEVGFQSESGFSTVSQTLTTSPGQQYTLSFWLSNNFGPANEFRVLFDGSSVYDAVNTAVGGYVLHSLTVTASGSSAVLELDGMNQTGVLLADDVDVSASGTPEPSALTLLTIGALGLALWRRRLQVA